MCENKDPSIFIKPSFEIFPAFGWMNLLIFHDLQRKLKFAMSMISLDSILTAFHCSRNTFKQLNQIMKHVVAVAITGTLFEASESFGFRKMDLQDGMGCDNQI